MLSVLLIGMLSLPTFADSTNALFAEQRTDRLAQHCATPPDRTSELLCRFRLYPLTDDAELLDDLPESLNDGSAMDLALLAGLWGMRASSSSPIGAMRSGMRSARLLDEARRVNPFDPYVLLVEGQSLLFRPKTFGGNPEAALICFRQLRSIVGQAEDAGALQAEADAWSWYAMNHLRHDEAERFRASLLQADLPALFHDFLLDPP